MTRRSRNALTTSSRWGDRYSSTGRPGSVTPPYDEGHTVEQRTSGSPVSPLAQAGVASAIGGRRVSPPARVPWWYRVVRSWRMRMWIETSVWPAPPAAEGPLAPTFNTVTTDQGAH